MARSARPLLRLVHSLERRRGPQYEVALSLRRLSTRASPPIVLGRVRFDVTGPRVFVVGTGERADLPTPPGLMPRHVAILTTPQPEGIRVRAFTLHPDRGISPFIEGMEEAVYFDGGNTSGSVGGVRALARLRIHFDGYVLEIQTSGQGQEGVEDIETIAKGEQLAFFNAAFLRPVGNVVSSVTGPGGGGHAIPALVTHGQGEGPRPGSLVLRSRDGVHRVEPVPHELSRGLLIGRSRRCILGRGFDENDGLSRIHAMVLRVGDAVYAFDLASRYGLRDVARPNRLINTARLDDGIGCLVYGAGHLLFEG